ncbi:MAG: SIR2 family protein [Clostridiales bacterium]|nr:SIR2 family protein [Clostridiales bacterium]
MSKYLKYVPKTLQEDFVDNKVVPFVGAGFSKNAILPQGLSMPDWNELGRIIANYITDYEYTNAIDALSLFESQFSKVRLIELLSKELYISDLKPGDAHRSLCDVFFDTICTTNFDFLLDRTLQDSNRPHSIIVSEDRLPINAYEKTRLVKLHGDFDHPDRMVITESDYDSFLDRNKVLATYISNLFITKTLFLVGYSFDDTDIRGLWQIINSRLGNLHRPAYALMVGASPVETSRFERRKVKVINLEGKKADYPLILNQFFIEVKEMIDKESSGKITVTSEKARSELKLPSSNKSLCFISAPYTRISFLKELLYPALTENDIVPLTLDEAVMPNDNILTKSETLLKESSLVIIDVSRDNINALWELGIVHSIKKDCIVIADESQKPASTLAFHYMAYDALGDNTTFRERFSEFIAQLAQSTKKQSDDEPERLLQKGEYDAAVISAFRLLETFFRKSSILSSQDALKIRPVTLSELIHRLEMTSIPNDLVVKVREYLRIRNQIVHEATVKTNKKTAMDVVKSIKDLMLFIEREGIKLE